MHPAKPADPVADMDGSKPEQTALSNRNSGFLFAHLSDLHLSDPSGVRSRDLLNKRLLGYLSWRRHRREEHSGEVVDALVRDLKRADPGHIVITGDLTHLGLPEEFREVSKWLSELGPPGRITVIPGNHETYIDTPWDDTMARWLPYMTSDTPPESGTGITADTVFPSLRIRDGIAFLGVSSARPSAPFLAVGSLGPAQLEALDRLLLETGQMNLYRVLLIHHPPLKETLGWRKRLVDAKRLRDVLRCRGVELVLHGHAHRPADGRLKTRDGISPVIGVPSGSAIGLKPGRRASYNLYRVTRTGKDWELTVEPRGYSPESGEFVPENQGSVSAPDHKGGEQQNQGNGPQGGNQGIQIQHQSQVGD